MKGRHKYFGCVQQLALYVR